MVRQKHKGLVRKSKLTMLCHTSGPVPRKDVITKQTVFTWVILGLYRTRIHIWPILLHSTYRATSDGISSNKTINCQHQDERPLVANTTPTRFHPYLPFTTTIIITNGNLGNAE